MFVRVGSHRARDKMISALGRKPQEYHYPITDRRSTELVRVRRTELGKLRGITGISHAKRVRIRNVRKSWSMM
jgi:hypothetical protein